MQHGWLRAGQTANDSSADERCLEAFEAELDYLFATLRRLGARPGAIDDLAHQVFLLLVRDWRRFVRRGGSLRLHLFGLAVRVLARQERGAPGTAAGSAEPLPLSLAALERVALKHRAVLLLHELEQLSLPEIARGLSMSRMGVALRLRQARAQLETATRQLAADWQAGRFGRPDLLAALGIRSGESPDGADPRSPSAAMEEIARLQDEIIMLEVVMDDLPDTIYFKDRESRFTRINRYAAAHYGIVSPAAAVGRTDFDFFTDEHAVQALRDEQQIIRTGQPLVSVEEQETLPDGQLRRVWTTKLPLRDRGGDIVGTFGLSRDISQRREAG
jgi:PAS domain S-box-containing protein